MPNQAKLTSIPPSFGLDSPQISPQKHLNPTPKLTSIPLQTGPEGHKISPQFALKTARVPPFSIAAKQGESLRKANCLWKIGQNRPKIVIFLSDRGTIRPPKNTGNS